MPTPTLEPQKKRIPASSSAKSDLADIVDSYQDDLVPTAWLTRLDLEHPRQNLKCLSPVTRLSKRAMDIVIASSLLIVTSPVILLAAVLVRLTSPGKAFYSQTRVGLNLREEKSTDRRMIVLGPPFGIDERRDPENDRRSENNFGRPFTMYKLRTMRSDAEKSGAQFAQKSDPRVTTIGRFLRRTRIDELPQLWNVIKGDMSMVGPRPERPEFMEELSKEIPNYVERLGLQPGLTGIAQVVNGYDNELEGFRRKIGYDLLYLQNCCVMNDLKILLRTFKVVVTGDGAV